MLHLLYTTNETDAYDWNHSLEAKDHSQATVYGLLSSLQAHVPRRIPKRIYQKSTDLAVRRQPLSAVFTNLKTGTSEEYHTCPGPF